MQYLDMPARTVPAGCRGQPRAYDAPSCQIRVGEASAPEIQRRVVHHGLQDVAARDEARELSVICDHGQAGQMGVEQHTRHTAQVRVFAGTGLSITAETGSMSRARQTRGEASGWGRRSRFSSSARVSRPTSSPVAPSTGAWPTPSSPSCCQACRTVMSGVTVLTLRLITSATRLSGWRSSPWPLAWA
jgi:hypothetical protein